MREGSRGGCYLIDCIPVWTHPKIETEDQGGDVKEERAKGDKHECSLRRRLHAGLMRSPALDLQEEARTGTWDVSQVTEGLPGLNKGLGLVPSPT